MQWLASCPVEHQCTVLAAALPWADADERDGLAVAAIDAAESAPAHLRSAAVLAMAAVIGRLHDLGSAVHHRLIDLSDVPPEAVHRAQHTGDAKTLANTIELIRMRRDVRLADELVSILDHHSSDLAHQAAQVLLGLTFHATATRTRRTRDADAMRRLDRLIVDAIADPGRHRVDALMLALVLLATPSSAHRGPCITRLLADSDYPVWFGIRRIVGRTEDPTVRQLALRWLGRDDLLPAVRRRWSDLVNQPAAGDVFCDGHLLLTASRRRALRSMDRPRACIPALATAMRMPEQAQRALPRYVSSLRLHAKEKAVRLTELASLPSPRARMHTIGVLSGRPEAAARHAIAALCDDSDRHVSAMAARDLLRNGDVPDSGLLRRLATHRDHFIASMARRRTALADVPAFIDSVDHFDRRTIASIGRVHLQRDGQRLNTTVAAGLTTASGSQLCALVYLIDVLDLSALHLRALLDLAHGDDARVVAAVSRALGQPYLCDTQAPGVMIELLAHTDGRVRSNAAEALVKADAGESLHNVSVLLDDSVPRPRATAAVMVRRARPDRARQVVRRLLRADRPDLALSGIWAARRVGGRVIAGELRELGHSAVDPTVRTRAGIAARFLDQRQHAATMEINHARCA